MDGIANCQVRKTSFLVDGKIYPPDCVKIALPL
jgi:hypothetical protein